MQVLARYITKGWGRSGYYSTRTLKRAEHELAFPKGTHIHWNHPTKSELKDRPERNLNTLVAESVEDAKYMVHPEHGEGLYAKIKVYPSHVKQVKEKGRALSILANGIKRLGEAPTAEGGKRKGYMIERIIPSKGNTVDFVTKAGAGGTIIFESAKELPADNFLLEEYAVLIESDTKGHDAMELEALKAQLKETTDNLAGVTDELTQLKEANTTLINENNTLKRSQAVAEALTDASFNRLLPHEVKAVKALVTVPTDDSGNVDDKKLLEALKETAKPFLEASKRPATVSGMGNKSDKVLAGVEDDFTALAKEAHEGLYKNN